MAYYGTITPTLEFSDEFHKRFRCPEETFNGPKILDTPWSIYEELTLKDNYMFGIIMSNLKYCKTFLETILGVKIKRGGDYRLIHIPTNLRRLYNQPVIIKI